MPATVHDLGLHVVEGGQVTVLFGRRIHGVHAPVLVAALVLEVDDMGVVLGPEVHPDAALLIVGHRLEVSAGGASHRTDPDVHDADFRCQVGEAFSVRGEARRYLLRVTEEDFAWDQGHGRSGGHKVLSEVFEHVGHRVEAWLRVSGEARGPQGAVGEGAAGEGAVDDLDLLSPRGEDEPVLSDHCAAAQGVDADLTFLPGGQTLPPVDRDLVQILSPALGRGTGKKQGRARGRVLLVVVVGFYDLDVVALAEFRRDLARHLAQEVDPDAHVRGAYYGDAVRSLLDPCQLLGRESRRPDDVRSPVGEVLYRSLRGGELDQDLGGFRRVYSSGYPYLPRAAELTEVGADLGGACSECAAFEFDPFRFEGRAADLASHAASSPNYGYPGHTSSGVGRRWFDPSITRRRVSRFSPWSGIIGSRISSEHRPRIEDAVLTGMGFVSTKSARKSGKSS